MDLIMLKDIMKALLIIFFILILIWGILVCIDAIRCFNYKEPKIFVLSIMTDTIYSAEGSNTVYTCLGYNVGILRTNQDKEIIRVSMSVLGRHLFTHDKRDESLKENTNNIINYKNEYENVNNEIYINIYNSVESEK